MDAATVIATVSTACGINPQVMLVTLQKESQLLDRTDPTETTYNAAWGWHCPDTGPGGTANCDPAYAGLFNQAYGMAKQWSRYRVDPGKYHYQAGQTVTILWNVAESRLRGSTSHHREPGHRALYNYTPYQPNAASLAAYPGTGDACSTYGNRNFFYLFVKNFGPTGGGKPDPNRQRRRGVGHRPGRHHPEQPQRHTGRGRPRHHSPDPGGRHRPGRRIQRPRPALRVGRRRRAAPDRTTAATAAAATTTPAAARSASTVQV